MNIGIPLERRPDEYRVGLTPAGVQMLGADGHVCYVERGAGLGAGFSDEDFAAVGARTVYSGEEAYGRADLVLKVARPTAEELRWLRPGQTVLAFWHLASASPDHLETLLQRRITAIALEMIQADDGTLPVLRPMSQIAGRMVTSVAAALLGNDHGGKGILLGGMPGVPAAEVVILGAGVVGTFAARAFVGLGASVHVLDHDLRRLEQIEERGPGLTTMVSHAFNIQKVVKFADVLVGAVLAQGERTPVLVTREMVGSMRPRSVVIDVAIDQGGCVETSRPTLHSAPTFIDENVIHYCVPNMPGVLGRTATHALSNATWPFARLLATRGAGAAAGESAALARGVATHDGQIVAASLVRAWDAARADGRRSAR
jgi:alanine dehydrogenase